MMKKIIIMLFVFVLCANTIPAMAIDTMNATAQATDVRCMTGLIPMTDEEKELFHSSIYTIVDVKPNKYALEGIEDANVGLMSTDIESIEPAPLGEEVIFTQGSQPEAISDETNENITFPLSASRDISTEYNTLPPVGLQKVGSCTSWALGYYMLSNNTNVIRENDAKYIVDGVEYPINENIISPGFIHRHVGVEYGNGSNMMDACAFMAVYGAANASYFPLDLSSNTEQQWCMDSEVWKKSLQNKVKSIYTYGNSQASAQGTDEFIDIIKKTISNRYAVSFATYIWEFKNPEKISTNDVSYVEAGNEGYHAMTIVGYDDNRWIDVNDDGDVDDFEYGAFKVVNSHGSGYADDGFVWISYDALYQTSRVEGGPTNRQPLTYDIYYAIPYEEYTPLLIAEVEIKTPVRNQVKVSFGISDSSQDEPNVGTFVIDGNYFLPFNKPWYSTVVHKNFSGLTGADCVEETILMPFDLTPLIKKKYFYGTSDGFLNSGTEFKLYVNVMDELADATPVTLGNVSIIEPITGNRVECSNNEYITVNKSSEADNVNNKATKSVIFNLSTSVMQAKDKNILLTFNKNISEISSDFNINTFLDKRVFNDNSYLQMEIINNKLNINPPSEGYDSDVGYKINLYGNVYGERGNGMDCQDPVTFYVINPLSTLIFTR